MTTYAYRVETVEFGSAAERQERVLALANRLGQEGWRLSSVSLEPRIAVNERRLSLLFELEAEAPDDRDDRESS